MCDVVLVANKGFIRDQDQHARAGGWGRQIDFGSRTYGCQKTKKSERLLERPFPVCMLSACVVVSGFGHEA